VDTLWQAAALLQLLRLPPAADEATAMRWAVKQGSLKVLTIVLSLDGTWYTAHSKGISHERHPLRTGAMFCRVGLTLTSCAMACQ